MTKKCIGCGSLMQSDDQNSKGYIRKDKIENSIYCENCFKLIHYGKISEINRNVDYNKIIDNINKSNYPVLFVIDILNLNEENLKYLESIKNKKYILLSKFDILPRGIKEGKIIKTYTALCNVDLENAEKLGSFPPCENLFRPEEKFYCQQSFFCPYGDGRKEVRPVTEASSKIIQKKVGKSVIYQTNIECQAIEKNQIKVKARISNGFRHQVRCHLAWMGLPVAGDKLYNYKNKEEDMKFFATQIELSGDIWYI